MESDKITYGKRVLIPLRMASMNKTSHNECWRGCGEKETFILCWHECKLVQASWKTVWRCPPKLRTELPYDSATIHLGIYPPNLETFILKNYELLCSLQHYPRWPRHGNNQSALR